MHKWAWLGTMAVVVALVAGCTGDEGITTHNSPPAATITLPLDGDSFVDGDTVSFQGTALDQGGSTTDLLITWTSSLDQILNEDPPDADGILEFATNELSVGTHVITLGVVDDGGLQDSQEVTIGVLPQSDIDADNDGYTPSQGDCDDTDADIHPGAEEEPNGVDDDCDGTIDEGTDLYDDDGDGFTETDGDCDDDDDETYPEAPEIADEIDNDCDGTIDEGTVFYDDDGDGYTETDGDCDDGDPAAYPNATEAPDGIDNDCDGTVDEGTVAYDDDGDGYTENKGDCDDTDADINPGETEVCDGSDNDCNGTVDDLGAVGCVSYYYDYDGDTYGVDKPQCQCGPTGFWTALQGGDCYDFNVDAKPGQTGWFTVQRGDGSFDYDCNGLDEKQYTGNMTWACPDIDSNLCEITTQGFDGGEPDCGDTGDWATDCTFYINGPCGWFCCDTTTTSLTQSCH